MKFESTQAESSFGLLVANLTTIVLGAFGNYEQTIEQLTKTLTVKDEEIKKLKEELKAFTEPKEPAEAPLEPPAIEEETKPGVPLNGN